MLTDALGSPQEQVPAGTQGIVEGGNDAVLDVGAEIDQQVAARHRETRHGQRTSAPIEPSLLTQPRVCGRQAGWATGFAVADRPSRRTTMPTMSVHTAQSV